MTATGTRDHHGSHSSLLHVYDGADRPPPGKVDALIVPTVRSPAYLKTAANLAARLKCPLVTLHSRKWTSPEATAQELRADIDLIAIDLPDHTSLGLPNFRTSMLLTGTRFDRRTDTSVKRNLGLTLSRMVSWDRIAFVDDDIEVPDPYDLARASTLLGTYNAVGLAIGGYPDNSVVCHAYRAAKGPQETFIGGGALVVRVSQNRSFFPNIYNEDWFYLLNDKSGIQPLAMTGSVVQRPYEPFRTPERARAEELGDVLAEGAFWLLDDGRSINDADYQHWRSFIAKRKRFIQSILCMIQDGYSETIAGEKNRILEALRAAVGRLEHITPALCLDYLRAFTEDRQDWQSYLDSLPSGQSLESALKEISNLGVQPLHRPTRRRGLILIMAGPEVHMIPSSTAGVTALIVTLLLAGTASIVAGRRRERRSRYGGRPRSPAGVRLPVTASSSGRRPWSRSLRATDSLD